MMWPTDEWLKSLKQGDKVVYNANRYSGEPHWVIATVNKVTPSGQVVTEKGIRFVEGRNRGAETHIEPLTDEIERQMWEYRVRYTIQTTHWNRVGMEKMERIYSILQEGKV